MNRVMQSCTTLNQNQRGLASRIDSIVDKLDAMDSQVLSISSSEGERTLKCFKKETTWNTLFKKDKIKDFDAHLENLNIRFTGLGFEGWGYAPGAGGITSDVIEIVLFIKKIFQPLEQIKNKDTKVKHVTISKD